MLENYIDRITYSKVDYIAFWYFERKIGWNVHAIYGLMEVFLAYLKKRL